MFFGFTQCPDVCPTSLAELTGFKGKDGIAAVLADTVSATGHRLQPWRMSPAALARSALPGVYVPDAAVLGAMCRWAERAGWDGIAAELRSHPLCLEQEALPADLPHVPHAP